MVKYCLYTNSRCFITLCKKCCCKIYFFLKVIKLYFCRVLCGTPCISPLQESFNNVKALTIYLGIFALYMESSYFFALNTKVHIQILCHFRQYFHQNIQQIKINKQRSENEGIQECFPAVSWIHWRQSGTSVYTPGFLGSEREM